MMANYSYLLEERLPRGKKIREMGEKATLFEGLRRKEMNASLLCGALRAAREVPCIRHEKVKEKQIPIDGQ